MFHFVENNFIIYSLVHSLVRMLSSRRNKVSDSFKVVEKNTLIIKLIVLLIKIGILPIFKNKDGKFVFNFFSWKTLVYLIFSIGLIHLYYYVDCLIFKFNAMDFVTMNVTITIDGLSFLVSYLSYFAEITLPLLLCHAIGKG